MTRLKASNAESGIYSVEGWTRISAGQEVVRDNTITPYAGSWSWCTGGDGVAKSSWLAVPVTAGNWMITRCYVRLGSFPASGSAVLWATGAQGSSGLSNQVPINILASGALQFPVNLLQDARSSSPLVIGHWHKLEVAYQSYAGDVTYINAIARLDGVEFGRWVKLNTGSSAIGRAMFTSAPVGAAQRTNIDELVVNDSTGASDNYWPDSVKPLTRASLGYVKPSVHSVGSFASKTGGGTTLTLTAPALISANDLLVAVIAGGAGSTGFTTPSGWSLVKTLYYAPSTTQMLGIYIKRATGSEPSTYTFTGNTTNASAIIYSLSNVGASPILDAQIAQIASTTSVGTPGLDLPEGDALLMEFVGWQHATALMASNFPSVTDGVVNNKDAAAGLGLCGGFFGANDGGLKNGELAVLSTSPLSAISTAQVAFQGLIPKKNKFLSVV